MSAEGGLGVDASEPFHFGEAGQIAGVHPERGSYETFMTFHDPDGNTWLVQEVKRDWRLQEVKIEEGAVKIDGTRVTDRALTLKSGAEHVFQVGSRRFARLRLEAKA